MQSNHYGDLLRDRLNYLSLTIYGASQIVGAETDEEIRTIHRRLTRHLKADPESIQRYANDIRALGGELVIVWKD